MSDESLDTKREQLFAAAENFIFNGKGVEQQRSLCEAASAYHIKRAETFKTQYGAGAKAQTNGNGAKYVIPFGRSKGTPIGEATVKDLEWVCNALKEKLDDADKARYRAKNAELIEAIEKELGSR